MVVAVQGGVEYLLKRLHLVPFVSQENEGRHWPWAAAWLHAHSSLGTLQVLCWQLSHVPRHCPRNDAGTRQLLGQDSMLARDCVHPADHPGSSKSRVTDARPPACLPACAFSLPVLQSTMNSVMGEWSALILRAFQATGSTKSPWSVVFRCGQKTWGRRGGAGQPSNRE